jgi:hypothetical protein
VISSIAQASSFVAAYLNLILSEETFAYAFRFIVVKTKEDVEPVFAKELTLVQLLPPLTDTSISPEDPPVNLPYVLNARETAE